MLPALYSQWLIITLIHADNPTFNQEPQSYNYKTFEFNQKVYFVMFSFRLANSSNIAFGKTVRQSSTVGAASRATDGSTRVSGNSCSKTKVERNPWLEVDLAGQYEILQVTLTNSERPG